jgi:hypothetical protein
MPDEDDEIVRLLGLELVTRLVPEELPVYPSLVSQFEGTASGRRNKSSDDQILGFGAGEVVLLMTPEILSFTRGFWDALVAQTAQNSLNGVVRRIQLLRAGHQNPPPLNAEQIQLVRKVAEQETRRLNMPKDQAGILTDAIVGALAAPAAS